MGWNNGNQTVDTKSVEVYNHLEDGNVRGTRRSSVQEHGDKALDLMQDERIDLTEEDNKRLRRKADKYVLSLLVWGYFLQILDKSVLGYGAIYGLQKDTHLVGTQYSLASSATPIAQLAWQPISSYLIVRVPHRTLLATLVLFWGACQACMAASTSFGGLFAARFMLGLLEGGCLPLFAIVTSEWWRRSEQPFRVACWYGTNGVSTIVAAALSYGLAKIPNAALAPWRILFMTVGLITVASAPVLYFFLPNDVATARFLNDHERKQTLERLRANQTGTGSREFKWDQVLEVFYDPKTYIWVGITLCINCGAQVTNTFGPLILKGIGFDPYKTTLLNMPFGGMQLITIILGSWACQRFKNKSGILLLLMLPIVAGAAGLYVLPRDVGHTAGSLVCYYLLAFIFSANPVLVSWIISNTAGSTKKSVLMAIYSGSSGAGNIIGPLLFQTKDAPAYHPGLQKVLAIFVTVCVLIILQFCNLFLLNKRQQRKRVANGKPAIIKDRSMESKYVAADVGNEDIAGGKHIGDNAFLDLTDLKNDEFVYVY